METRSASSVCEVGADVGILPDEDPATAYGVDTEEAGRADGAAEEEEATVIELLFAAADVDGTASPIRFEKKGMKRCHNDNNNNNNNNNCLITII